MDGQETCPLPDDPALAEAASALNVARAWAHVVDRDWRWVYMTDDVRLSLGRPPRMIDVPLGLHYFGPETADSEMNQRAFRPETSGRCAVAGLGPWLLADARGGRAELREVLDARYHDLIDAIEPDDRSIVRSFPMPAYTVAGAATDLLTTAWRIRDTRGRLAGTVIQTIPAAGMTMLGTLASAGDAGHFARMQSVAKAGRRPAAILFADLEASSPLARRLSTASYFALGRRLDASRRSVRGRRGRTGRQARRRRRGRVLPRHERRFGIGGRACLHQRSPRPANAPWPMSPRAATCSPRTSSCASDCIGAPPSTSGRSRPAAAARSPRSATRSTKPRASRPARPADAHSRPRSPHRTPRRR